MSMSDDIAEALLTGESLETGANRTILRAAVMRQIMCPFSGDVLDVRRAVLIDGSDYERTDGKGRGKMVIMTAEIFDAAVERAGGLEKLAEGLKFRFDVYDGRELFQ
jgi:hypothetical protein